jgi:hypothetical protein
MSYHPHRYDAKHKITEMQAWELNHAFHWASDEEGSDEAMQQAWEEHGYYSWPLSPAGWDTCRFFLMWEEYVKDAFVQIMIDKYLAENPLDTPEEVNQ